MATSETIGQEKQRIAERLARLDTERTKLAEQLNELEVAERVLSRFGKTGVTGVEPRRRGRPARTAAPAQGPSLNDAALKAVEAHGNGATAGEISSYLARELGMTVRPNHLGIALQRHRRAGRLDNRDQRWFLPQAGGQELSQSEGNQMSAG